LQWVASLLALILQQITEKIKSFLEFLYRSVDRISKNTMFLWKNGLQERKMPIIIEKNTTKGVAYERSYN